LVRTYEEWVNWIELARHRIYHYAHLNKIINGLFPQKNILKAFTLCSHVNYHKSN
jgi:hypothetical protein